MSKSQLARLSAQVPEIARLRAQRDRMVSSLGYLKLSTETGGQWENWSVCTFVRALLAEIEREAK